MGDSKNGIELADFMNALRVELGVAVSDAEGQRFRFSVENVKVELEVSAKATGNKTAEGKAGFKFWVWGSAEGSLGVQSGREDQVRQKLTLDLKVWDSQPNAGQSLQQGEENPLPQTAEATGSQIAEPGSLAGTAERRPLGTPVLIGRRGTDESSPGES